MLAVQAVSLSARQHGLQPYPTGTLQSNALATFRYGADSGISPLSMPINSANRNQFLYVAANYNLNTYLTSYGYVNGQNSFAVAVALAFAESIALSDSFSTIKEKVLAFSETLNLTDDEAVNRIALMSFFDSIGLTDTFSPGLVVNITLPENLALGDSMYAPGGGYSVYAMNTTNTAVSLYRNWDFQSMAKIGDTYFGASQEGLFKLEGSDDNGTDINAAVITQSLDFRTQQLKSMGFAVLGIAQSGNIYISVVHENNPTYTYRLVTSDETMRNARAIFGKGMALRYWQFEIVNEGGADFELESITYYPVVLTRRITER